MRRNALVIALATAALAACSRSGEAKIKAAGADLKRAGVSTAAAAGKVGGAALDSARAAAGSAETGLDRIGRDTKHAVHKATR